MLKVLNIFFNFYVKSSIHVALSVVCLSALSVELVQGIAAQNMLIFIFFSTLFTYNFIKYFPFNSLKRIPKEILIITVISGLIALFLFFKLNIIPKMFVLFGGVLVLIYTIPFFGNTSNWRNKKGWKIHLVAITWVLLTVGVPMTSFSNFSLLLFFKWSVIQFIFVWVATLPFEIRDVLIDDKNLQTIPQQYGVNKTKQLGLFLLLIGLIFALFAFYGNTTLIVSIGITFFILGLALFSCSPNSSSYFTSFWIEGIPIAWCLGFSLFSYFY